MAAIDFLLLCCAILMFGLPGITQYLTAQYENDLIDSTHNILSYLLPWVYSVGMVAQTASVYLTVTVTIERYLAVCFPFMARTFCTRGRARKAVLFVISFSLLYNSTRFFEYRATYSVSVCVNFCVKMLSVKVQQPIRDALHFPRRGLAVEVKL